MTSDPQAQEGGSRAGPSASLRVRAFSVHIFTAAGAAVAMLALIAATERRWALMFLLLGIALIIDGVDGTLARRFGVAAVLPRWSGEVLDHVIDFMTYVVVPAYALSTGGLLPDPVAIPLGLVIVVTSALYFADRAMKTPDHYFRGFPAVWNVIAFYLFLLHPPPWISAAAIVTFAILTFTPVAFVHPMRVRRLFPVNVALLGIWAVLALIALMRDFAPGPWVAGGLCAIAVYFIGFGLARSRS